MRHLVQHIVLTLATCNLAYAGDIVVDQNHPRADDRNAGTPVSPLKTISAASLRTLPGIGS